MRRCTTVVLAFMLASLLHGTTGEGAQSPAVVQLPAGARVGIVNLVDAEVTHFHASSHLENSYLKTYSVSWPVSTLLVGGVRDALAQLGLQAVPLAPSAELVRARESCFLNAALARGLPKECAPLYAQLAAAEHLNALIVLGPGRNDAAHAGSARHKGLPDYLRGWCVVTSEGSTAGPPQLLDLTELLLVATGTGGAQLADREWGGDGGVWSGYQPPADLKAIPSAQLDQLEPLFAALLKHQADELLKHVQVTH
jgi:hypothetical protein